ncbi:hypothetical protein LZC95_06360 [Pendulispora brunnea]|uniref:Uncharacterized protein n=1 Tax=Pendulispora brunnea TaxID=2905690 RepID=A0ABZ2KCX4_9BACT
MRERRPRFLWLMALLVPVIALDVWLHVREKPKAAAAKTEDLRVSAPRETVAAASPMAAPRMASAVEVRQADPSTPSSKPVVPVQVQQMPPVAREEPGSNADEPPVVTLAQVGDIALGVRQDPRLLEIRDEARLKQVLERVGQALQERVRQHPEEGSAELVERLADYREELGRYMSGDVQIRGPGWTIETETGPALPQEKWWTPRP